MNHRAELRRIAAGFASRISDLGDANGTGGVDRGITPQNIALMLPFFLIEGCSFAGDVEAARAMAFGNAFGAAHFLAQDRLLDGDEDPDPERCRLSDRCLILFVRSYGRIFPETSPFWNEFDRCLSEYFESLKWEAAVLRTDAGRDAVDEGALPDTFLRLGHRMSPLKATPAGMALLSGREELLSPAERLIEHYHAAYQLSDDLDDLTDDLRAGRWSVVAWIIARRSGLASPPASADPATVLELAVKSGALEMVTDEIHRRYGAALDCASELGSPSLRAFLSRCLDESGGAHRWGSRRAAVMVAAGAYGSRVGPAEMSPDGDACDPSEIARRLPRIHRFEVDGDRFALDVESGLFFVTDALASEVLAFLTERPSDAAALRVLKLNYGSRAVEAALREISQLGRNTTDAASDRRRDAVDEPSTTSVTTLALNVTDGCNLSCDYCYLGTGKAGTRAFMSESVARSAVDLLVTESFGEPRVSIVFFGGEPLLRPEFIELTVGIARERVEADGRAVTFNVTTNGTLLTPDAARRLSAIGVRVLVSMDGDEADHDAHRVYPDGRGSYKEVARNIRSIPAGVRVGARVTVSDASSPLPSIVGHMRELGFSIVHLAPISGRGMPAGFAQRLAGEFEELARDELQALACGKAPSVGNFVEVLASLKTGRRRTLPCGAGARYVCVAPDGELMLCHRFAGDKRYAVGHVRSGLDRAAVGRILSELRGEAGGCAACWARHLCGGPCFYDLRSRPSESVGERATRCALRRRIFELSMWLYASLPEERRRPFGQTNGGR